jgi:hypothetical protein
MPLTRNFEIRRTGLGRSTLHGVLALTMIAGVAGRTAGMAFAQDRQPPDASALGDEASSDVLKSRVLQLPKGSYVEVRLTDGRKIEGRLGDVVNEGFMLQTVSKNRLTDRLVRFEEMQSVTPFGGSQPRAGTLELTVVHGKLILGLAAGGVTVGLTFDTPPKVANNVAAHVSVTRKSGKDEAP